MTLPAKAKPVFLSAILLLCLCAVASYLSFSYFRAGERWVSHTQEVKAVVGEVEAAVSNAARARMSYLLTGEVNDLQNYRAAVERIAAQMRALEQLTGDNPEQRVNVAQLQQVARDGERVWEESVRAKQQGAEISVAQLVRESLESAEQSAAASERVREKEDQLLAQRTKIAHRRFMLTNAVVVGSFAVALLLLIFYQRLLSHELQLREEAEQTATQAYARESALRQQEQRFRLFIDAVRDYAIFTLDPEGRVSSWNEGAMRQHGYTVGEIIGRNFSCFFPEEDVQAGKPQAELERAKAEGRIEDEGWRVRKDGSRLWANFILTAIRNHEGELIGFAKVTRDFTDRMQAQEDLTHANVELLEEVAERKLAEAKLENSERSLRNLSRHLLQSQDEERRRIGRDLHDSLGQALAVMKMNLDSLRQQLGAQASPGAVGLLDSCTRQVEEAIREVRTIAYLLFPPMLEEMGLKSAIPWYLDGFAERSKIRTTFEIEPGFDRLAPEEELALFRILQESLTNIHRHSGSPTANIKLSIVDGWACMEVWDQGKGIPALLLEKGGEDWMGALGVGLRGMHERMRQLGGRLEVKSTERGTVVTASIPVALKRKLDRTA